MALLTPSRHGTGPTSDSTEISGSTQMESSLDLATWTADQQTRWRAAPGTIYASTVPTKSGSAPSLPQRGSKGQSQDHRDHAEDPEHRLRHFIGQAAYSQAVHS